MELLDNTAEGNETDGTRSPTNLFLVSVPILDKADESNWIWQFTTRIDDAASLIERLNELLYENERWLMQRFCWDDAMADCGTLADAGYVIGDFTVVKLGCDLPPCSNSHGPLEHIDLGRVHE